MAPFALDIAVAFRRGSARGERSQIYSMGMERNRFMQEIGDRVNKSVLAHRETFENRRLRTARENVAGAAHPAFTIARDNSDPKRRWVNGTPEYSFGICGLRKLFPDARFIHIVRDCDLVAASMLHFDRVGTCKLVETKEEGYETWLRYVRACVLAEIAFGPDVVKRVFLQDIIDRPENAIRSILKFLGEPFNPVCLEPLAKRINSSRAAPGSTGGNPVSTEAVICEARQYWQELQTSTVAGAKCEAATLMEEQFEKRVDFIFRLEAEFARAQRNHFHLQAEFGTRSEWALQLNAEIETKNQQIRDLQVDLEERTKWALRLDEEIAQKDSRILALQSELEDRTAWAFRLREKVEQMQKALKPAPRLESPESSGRA
jgi:hypothetical protein